MAMASSTSSSRNARAAGPDLASSSRRASGYRVRIALIAGTVRMVSPRSPTETSKMVRSTHRLYGCVRSRAARTWLR